ncbi:MAG TPA: hypothetical protein DDW52_14545 [Planctomycetaceae bacterium]|nr:hypothetical protein [Planctomycetaceae bacterium]
MQLRILLSCLLWFAVGQTVVAQTLHTSSDIFQNADLLSCENDKLTFRVATREPAAEQGSKEVTCDLRDLAAWGAIPIRKPGPYLWLRDGSWLAGQPNLFERKWGLFGETKWETALQPSAVAGCLLTPPANPYAFRRLISQMQAASGEQDWIWLDNGTTLAGLLKVSSGPDANLQFELTSGQSTQQIPVARVRAFVFSPALSGAKELKRLRNAIGFSDGSVVAVGSVRKALQLDSETRNSEISTRQSSALLNTQGGSQLQFAVEASKSPAESLVDQVVFLHQSSERWVWLNTASPVAYRHSGLGAINWTPGLSPTTIGKLLPGRLGICCNLLTMRASSQITFRIPSTASHLLTEVSLEQSPQTQGDAATFEVLGVIDGQLVNLATHRIAIGESKPIRVDVQGSPLVILICRRDQTYAAELICSYPRVVNVASRQDKQE